MCSRFTLMEQAGLSLAERAATFNRRFPGRKMTAASVRKAYSGKRITQQRMVWKPTRGSRWSQDRQVERLATIKRVLKKAYKAKVHLLQMDSAIFSPKKYNDRTWAPAGVPLT